MEPNPFCFLNAGAKWLAGSTLSLVGLFGNVNWGKARNGRRTKCSISIGSLHTTGRIKISMVTLRKQAAPRNVPKNVIWKWGEMLPHSLPGVLVPSPSGSQGADWASPLQRAQGELLFFTDLCFLLAEFDNESFGALAMKVRRMLQRRGWFVTPGVSRLRQLCLGPLCL